jgi:hypothetical protein
MKQTSKISFAIALALGTFSLSACGSTTVNHAAASCDAYDEVIVALHDSSANAAEAVTTSNAGFAATLAVWQSEGGEPADLYEKLSGYAGALEGFILTNSPESAQEYLSYDEAESDNIKSLCAAARG